MKILMISMFSPHFFNWTEQLKNSVHEIYWIDVFDSNTHVQKIDFVHQVIGWRNKVDYFGRYFLKNNFRGIYHLLNILNQKDLKDIVEEKIEEINPDVVHSFIMQSATYPIVDIMKSHPQIKWIYSAWGNDLYFRQQDDVDLQNIKTTLPQIDFMFADCERDHEVAVNHGFVGQYLGTFATGGGYDLVTFDPFIEDYTNRNILLIKGYQGKLGRCNVVLEALLPIKEILTDYHIIVFGANQQVLEKVKRLNLDRWTNFEIKMQLSHQEVLKLMGKSMIYIGNSISDGMPNTLLEAIVMETFPIQSNPGGATSEIIKHKKNGFLIQNPEDSGEIADLLLEALKNTHLLKAAIDFNNEYIKPKLEREYIKKQVLQKYRFVEENL